MSRPLYRQHAGLTVPPGTPRRRWVLTLAQVRAARAAYDGWRRVLDRDRDDSARIGGPGGIRHYFDDPDVPPTLAALARRWGVHPSTVWDAATGMTYRWVP